MEDKTRECFQFINNTWKDENYKTCIDEWNNISQFIVSQGDHKCPNCKTCWKDQTFIFEEVCPKCDTNIQPYLSNPLNISNVLNYIHSKHWKYIFPIFQQFKELEDPHDILDFKYDTLKFVDHLIGYKEKSEYGTSITLYHYYGEKYITCFLDNDNDRKYFITSFVQDGKGLGEEIYSNRTEYYINGKYYGNILNDKIEDIIKKINYLIIDYKVTELFYEFLNSDDTFIIIPKSEFNGIDLEIISCDNCETLDNVNICDFCEKKYCDICCPDEISFHKCDTCSTSWCYFDGRYYDDYCENNRRQGGLCSECGH